MGQNTSSQFNLNTGTDLAFALVVFITYFTTFSNSPIVSLARLVIVICLGVSYIYIGIYGFSYARKSKSLRVKAGYFIIQFITGGLIVYFGRGAGFNALILLPIVAHTAMVLDQDWTLAANAGTILTYIVAVYAYSHSFAEVWKGLPLFFAGQVFILIFTQMAVTEQKARQKLEKLANELSEANTQLSEYAGQVHQLTITQERNRMAREIHDGLGHYLTTINMQIKAATANLKKDPENADRMLKTAQQLTSDALIDVRNSVYALRQDQQDTLSLPDRIQKLLESTSSKQRQITFRVLGDPREVSPEVEVTLFRAAQETINNAQKHSEATQIDLTLDYTEPKTIILKTHDNGVGVENLNIGFGLMGIQERVRLLKGDVVIQTDSGKGFSVNVQLNG